MQAALSASPFQRRASPQTTSYRFTRNSGRKTMASAFAERDARKDVDQPDSSQACRESDAPVAAQRFSNSRFAATYMLQRRADVQRNEKTLQTYTALAPPRSISAKGYKNVSG